MEDNPFTALIAGIREEAKGQVPTFVRFGTVISGAPLTVDVAQTMQDSGSLLKDSSLGEFSPGETLLLVPIEEEQRFIIICKVVGV